MTRLYALLIGAFGGLCFSLFNLPLAWLLGALSFCLIATFSGIKLSKPGSITYGMRGILGVAIGSAFTPDLTSRLPELFSSLIFLFPYALITGLSGYYYFRKIGSFDKATAFYSAMPGGFQDMVAMGEEAGAKIQKLALIHATRIIVLVFALPFLVTWIKGFEVHRNTIYVWPAYQDSLILIICGFMGWGIAKRLNVSGASIVGPMIASALVHYFGITTATPPKPLIDLAQLIIGIHIGCQYQGMKFKDMAHTLFLSCGYLIILGVITLCFVYVLTTFIGAAPIAALLAFSPGGQAEMNLIALALNIDITYVALHHLVRMIIVIMGAQVIYVRLLAKKT
jgi:uncharacterized protein